METPTILYLNNRYINSLEELKTYFGSKLNEAQKSELIASFRDEVLYNWLNEGGANEKEIAEKMQLILGQHLGNGEVLAKIVELFDVPNPLIADYKFVDHAEYLGCVVLGLEEDQTQCPKVSNDGVAYLKKGMAKCRIVFKFKILAPENDFLTLQLLIHPKIEQAISVEMAKLDLVGEKNEIKTLEIEIDVEKLPKECRLTLLHDNSEVGRVTIDNHENTDKIVEATEETIPEGYRRTNMAARVCRKRINNTNNNNNNQVVLQYGFYDIQGNEVLTPELKLLKNPMYPNLDFGFYYRKIKEKDKNKIRLYHIDEKGYQDLGVFSFANPLNENLVAVCKTNESKFFGIIDKTGKTILEDDKVGQVFGISKDGCLVCEVRPGTQGLANLQGEELCKDRTFKHYFVGPNSDLIYAFDECSNYSRPFCYSIESDSFSESEQFSFYSWEKIDYVFFSNQKVFVRGTSRAPVFISGYTFGVGIKNACSGWCIDNVRDYIVVNDGDDLHVWLDKPLFPLFKVGSKFHTSNNNAEVKPVIVADNWMLEYNSQWKLYENKEESFNKVSDFWYNGELFAINCCSGEQEFVHYETSNNINIIELLFLNDELKPGEKGKINYRGIKGIESVVSYGDYIAVRFLYQADGVNKKTPCSLIITREGEKVKEDLWNKFSFICGPFDGKYYYLEHGELWRMDENEKNREKLSGWDTNKLLKASELYPLGTTGNFVIKNEKGYQIIDNQGNKLGEPFHEFNVSLENCPKKEMVMDYIYNSRYLPIKNAEGKCGLIDTNGKVIVPCEYDEVEDLNSIFKQQGIVVF